MEAAEGIIKIVNESMFGALRLVSVEQGYDPRDFALVAFGGAGPLHGNAMGLLTDSWPVIVPPGPGRAVRLWRRHHPGAGRGLAHLCDHGRATSPLSSCWPTWKNCAATASAGAECDGIGEDQQEVIYQADIRYAGQAFQISLEFDADRSRARASQHLTGRFDAEHEQLFTFALGNDHELVMIRAIVRGQATGYRPGGHRPRQCHRWPMPSCTKPASTTKASGTTP